MLRGSLFKWPRGPFSCCRYQSERPDVAIRSAAAAEAAWVGAADADAVVPVPGPGAELLGVLVVGRRFDGRTVRPVDMPFLEAVGAAAGLAVARLRVAHGRQARPLEALPAQECPVCRCVTGPEEAPGCDCGFGYVEAEVPKVLAGKFELQRRLGARCKARERFCRSGCSVSASWSS